LWINLPRALKMSAPRYRDIPARDLAHASGDTFALTAIAGDWQLGDVTLQGPLEELAALAAVADLQIEPGATVAVATPPGETLLGYIYEGAVEQDGSALAAQQLLVTSDGDSWIISAGERGASLLLLRGEPLAEPVAHYGPFVMNTPAEIEQALQDYRSGQFA